MFQIECSVFTILVCWVLVDDLCMYICLLNWASYVLICRLFSKPSFLFGIFFLMADIENKLTFSVWIYFDFFSSMDTRDLFWYFVKFLSHCSVPNFDLHVSWLRGIAEYMILHEEEESLYQGKIQRFGEDHGDSLSCFWTTWSS